MTTTTTGVSIIVQVCARNQVHISRVMGWGKTKERRDSRIGKLCRRRPREGNGSAFHGQCHVFFLFFFLFFSQTPTRNHSKFSRCKLGTRGRFDEKLVGGGGEALLSWILPPHRRCSEKVSRPSKFHGGVFRPDAGATSLRERARAFFSTDEVWSTERDWAVVSEALDYFWRTTRRNRLLVVKWTVETVYKYIDWCELIKFFVALSDFLTWWLTPWLHLFFYTRIENYF